MSTLRVHEAEQAAITLAGNHRTPLTRAQRVALKRVFDRGPVTGLAMPGYRERRLTYREFRRTVQRECYGDALMVHWHGIWLGIEPDGYTHS